MSAVAVTPSSASDSIRDLITNDILQTRLQPSSSSSVYSRHRQREPPASVRCGNSLETRRLSDPGLKWDKRGIIDNERYKVIPIDKMQKAEADGNQMAETWNVDKKWFERMIAAKNLPSQRFVANAIGIHNSTLSLIFDGKRKAKLDVAKKLARLLDVPLTEVISRLGGELKEAAQLAMMEAASADEKDAASVFSLVGWIDDHSAVHMFAKKPGAISLDVTAPPDAVALQYRTSGTAAEPLDGWIVVILPERPAVAEEMSGRYCVVGLANGDPLLRTVRPGQVEGRFNLFGANLPPIYDAEVSWFSPVVVIRPA